MCLSQGLVVNLIVSQRLVVNLIVSQRLEVNLIVSQRLVVYLYGFLDKIAKQSCHGTPEQRCQIFSEICAEFSV